MNLSRLVVCLCPLAVGAIGTGQGLLLGAAAAFCLLFITAGESMLRPYMAPAFCLPLRFLLGGLAVFLFRLAAWLCFYPLAHSMSALSLAGVVAAIILLTGDADEKAGWRDPVRLALVAAAWLTGLGAVRGLCAYGDWFVVWESAPFTGPLPLLAGPSGALLLSGALLGCVHVIRGTGMIRGIGKRGNRSGI